MTIRSGEYEHWRPTSPRDLVSVTQSSTFTAGVHDTIASVKAQRPNDQCTAIIANSLMHVLPALAASLKLKPSVLAPTPYCMTWTADDQHATSTTADEVTSHDIGGSPLPVTVQLGDVIDLLGPMYKPMFKQTFDLADGQV